MTKPKTPTVNEWLDEMERLTPNDPGLTVNELAQLMDLTRPTMRYILARDVANGLYIAGKARRPGVKGLISVYRVAKGGGK